MGVRKPGTYGDSVLRMKDIGGRRVVDDDGLAQVAAYLREILHIVTLVVVAAFPE